MGRSSWYRKWQADKSFIIENDILKDKAYVFSYFPKMNQYGLQDLNIRGMVYADIMARYHRMMDMNVLYPQGFHSLGNSSYIESKRNSNSLDDKIQEIFYKQMLELGIGINENKLIDMRHDEFVGLLQLAFIELYDRGYIKYKDYEVYIDNSGSKIYDSLNTPDKDFRKTTIKAFTLELDSVINMVAKNILELDINSNLKDKLYNLLEPAKIMNIGLTLSNGNTLRVSLDRPQYMGGISFIFLNPEFIDITPYIAIDEYHSVMEYLENGGRSFAYTGLQAINPLTGKEIPIFISTMYEEAIYLGIPNIDRDAHSLVLAEGLDEIEIIKDNTLINSDLLDGLTEAKAKDKIFEAFIDADIASAYIAYNRHEILLSSLDSFGPLFPFLIERGVRLNPLTAYLPYNFSSQFRPVLPGDVNIPGEALGGTINNLFVDGMTPIIAMLYDELALPESIFSEEALNEFKAWGSIKEMAINEDSYISELFMPIIFNNIIKKEIPDTPILIKGATAISKSLDSNNKELKRSNNNLIDFNRYLSSYYADTIRLYSMLNKFDEPLIASREKIEELDNLVRSLSDRLNNISNSDNSKLDFYYYRLISQSKSYLDKADVVGYCNNLLEFIKSIVLEEEISKEQCLLLIKCIFPVMPYLADMIYHDVFKSEYSLINESL